MSHSLLKLEGTIVLVNYQICANSGPLLAPLPLALLSLLIRLLGSLETLLLLRLGLLLLHLLK